MTKEKNLVNDSDLVIRNYQSGEEPALFEVFYSAIHLVASRDYTAEQTTAWAPRDHDPERWVKRMAGINPYVVVMKGEIVAYADLQSDGYIDHFFVSGQHGGCGIGTVLMKHLFKVARDTSIKELSAGVSRTAQPFFAKFGFHIVEHNQVEVRGTIIPNALMRYPVLWNF